MAPGNFEDEVNEACQPSQWSPVITQAFALYRVLVNFWMIIGLSFFGIRDLQLKTDFSYE